MTSNLQMAVAAIKAGDKLAGQELLRQIIKAEPHNEQAWLWLAAAVSSPAERRHCLQRVLKINPDNKSAQQGLAALAQQTGPAKAAAPEPVEAGNDDLPPTDADAETDAPSEKEPPRRKKLRRLKTGVQPNQTPPAEPPAAPKAAETAMEKPEPPPLPPDIELQKPEPLPLPLPPMEQEATKKCPYCAETIKAEAKVCRYCGREIDGNFARAVVEQPVRKEVHVVVEHKDPNTTGCLNALVPGLGYVYVGNLARGLITFVVASIIAVIIFSFMSLDGGLFSCPVTLVILFVLFAEGRNAARKHNQKMESF